MLGIAIGIPGGLGLTHLLRGLLYGVGPNDLSVFAAVSIGLAAVAVIATYVPARRAMKVDPMIALRYE